MSKVRRYTLKQPAKPKKQYRVRYEDELNSEQLDVVMAGEGPMLVIAGAAAAEIYGAEIAARGIEDHRENFTRFILLTPLTSSLMTHPSSLMKTTILFRTPNKPGALFRALAAFALRDINLTKLESRPIEGRPWEYSFYLDLGGDAAEANVARAIEHLREMCETVRVLGSYPAAAFT